MGDEQFVVERDDRFARSGIALPAGAAEELPVDARRVVVLRQDDVQAAGLHALPSLSTMSVPRPAMLVATVIRPAVPACG
jgi:hypothetical protein